MAVGEQSGIRVRGIRLSSVDLQPAEAPAENAPHRENESAGFPPTPSN